MPFQTVNLNATERATLKPNLIVPAEILKKRLDLTSPRTPPRNLLSPRLEAPARQLQSNFLRVRVAKLINERPEPKRTVVSPRLARVSKMLEMQRKKDVVSRNLAHREPQEPPKLAFSLQSLARQLTSKMLRDKVSQQLSPALLRKRSELAYEDTSLDRLNETLTQAEDYAVPELFTLSPKMFDFASPKKDTLILEAVPALQQVVDESGWEVVSRKKGSKKKKAPKEQNVRGKKGSNKNRNKKRNQRADFKPRRQPRQQQKAVEQKRSGVYPPTATANNANRDALVPWFHTLSKEEKEAQNRRCALRRIMKKEEKTRLMLLNKIREREAAAAGVCAQA